MNNLLTAFMSYILLMLKVRAKRISRTSIPNQSAYITPQTTQQSFFNIAKPIPHILLPKPSRTLSVSPTSHKVQRRKNNTLALYHSCPKHKAAKERSQGVQLPKQTKRRQQRNSLLEELDFQLGNIKKVIDSTALGALSERHLIHQFDQGILREDTPPLKKLILTTKMADSEEDLLGNSALQETQLIVPQLHGNRHERRRKSSVASTGSVNNNILLNFILGSEDIIGQHREYQRSILQRVKGYQQRQTKIDFKNQWKS